MFDDLQKKYGKDALNVIEQFTVDLSMPVNVFNPKLSCLEIVVKFLKENRKLEFNEIAVLLDRSVKTVWQAYDFAKKKYDIALDEELAIDMEKSDKDYIIYNIPIAIFKDRELSMLENLVKYLKGHYNLKLSQIAKLIHRDQRTVWTIYSRAMKKMK